MRYARLKKEWLLRGWADKPWALLNWKTGDCRQLSEQMFSVAQACDGRTDVDAAVGFLQSSVFLDKLIGAGLAEECRQGEEIAPFQRYRKADNPYVRSVHWSVTGRCNLKCRHCYMESPAGNYGELPLTDMLGIVDNLAAANIHRALITGGEPFLRRDLLDIMAVLANNQIAVTDIFSNGVLITDEALQGIKKLGFSPTVQISFDGYGTHDAMRGVPGAERAAVQAIRRLRAHGFRVAVGTSIDRDNVGSLAATYKLMKELDVQAWRVGPPVKVGNWRCSTTSLSFEEMLAACTSLVERWAEEGRPFELETRGYASALENDGPNEYGPESYDCLAWRLTLTLLPDGTVIPCPGFTDAVDKARMPNLLAGSVAAVLSQPALRALLDIKKSTVLAHNSECATCAEFTRCGGGCRASAAAATGDLLSVDRQICAVYKGKYDQRFKELASLGRKTAGC